MAEEVLVVSRDVIEDLGAFQGVLREGRERYYSAILRNCKFMPRDEAEHDPNIKQIIPYVVLTCRGRVYLMRRTHKQAEERLRGLYSLGIGGHINPGDDDELGGDPIERGMSREFQEEVDFRGEPKFSFEGLINDDTTPVGRSHLGLIFSVESSFPGDVAVRESDKMEGRFASLLELREVRHLMEGWARFLYDQYLSEEPRNEDSGH
ncbi:MAG: NUDIX domain-containing protein [bacterium]